MRVDKEKRPVTPISGKRRAALDGTAMLIYLCLVYLWALWLYPLGRDYAFLAEQGANMPFLAGRLFAWEVGAFGSSPVGYHLVNLAFLYACMLCVYRFVRLSVKGPFWLGTLAATLFMANPIHSESILNLAGVADLVPALLALLALTAYAELAAKPRLWRWALALIYFALAVLPYRQNAALVLVVVLYEWLVVDKAARRWWRVVPFAVIAFDAWAGMPSLWAWPSYNLTRMFAPLYFVFYPLGFLPETARTFHVHPWLGYLAVLVILAVVGLVYRKARRPVILFGLLGMVAVRFGQGFDFVDPVHLIGGGRLLVANALFNVALVALFFRMMDHPKWRQPVVVWTTVLCVVFFALELRCVAAWHRAGDFAERFQEQAAGAAGEQVGIVPDYQYYRGAPMCLSESVAYDTPFSKAVPAVPLLQLNCMNLQSTHVMLDSWTAATGTVVLQAPNVLDLAPYPYTLVRPNATQRTDGALVTTRERGQNQLTLLIRSRNGALPRLLLPAGK